MRQLNGDADIIDNTITTFDIATDAIDSDEVLDFGLTQPGRRACCSRRSTPTARLANSSGGVTSSSLGTGVYQIDFGRDISFCGFTGTQGEAGVGGAGGAIVGLTDRSGNANAIFATTARTPAARADQHGAPGHGGLLTWPARPCPAPHPGASASPRWPSAGRSPSPARRLSARSPTVGVPSRRLALRPSTPTRRTLPTPSLRLARRRSRPTRRTRANTQPANLNPKPAGKPTTVKGPKEKPGPAVDAQGRDDTGGVNGADTGDRDD